jgi:hypothetical protein
VSEPWSQCTDGCAWPLNNAAGPGGHAGKPGPPIFLSYPHYCGADPALAQGVTGVACDPAAHELFVDVGEAPLP